MSKRTIKDIEEEAMALLMYFERRGLSGREAVAVMGVAITSFLSDPDNLQEFIRLLQSAIPHN